ncbi:hypothetical protein FJ250_12115 [bacterium]|nr:hypothetical protein [bacterium]
MIAPVGTGSARLAVLAALAAAWSAPQPAAAQGAPPPAAGAAVAAPDTARLGFAAPGDGPAPPPLHVLADTVAFGGEFAVAWDLAAGAGTDAPLPAPADPQLVLRELAARPWWRPWGGATAAPATRLDALPPAAGPRVVAWYRAYRTGPFRLVWQGDLSPVVTVRGRVSDPASLAAIRDPRPLPWLTPAALALLSLLFVLAALAVWWRRRGRPSPPTDWPLPEPAWLGAAISLRGLLAEELLERGQTRAFLDRLAGAARRYAAAQYRVPAADLTGAELAAACEARGHAPAGAAALARLLAEADLRRYDPREPEAPFCREQVSRFVACVAAARFEPRYSAVAAERRLAADQAWAEITRLWPPAGRPAGAGGGV